MLDSILLAEVQAFLRDRVESYEQLAILLLLRTRGSDSSWSPSAVAKELHLPESVAEQELQAFCRQGLSSVAVYPDRVEFRYRPESPELAILVEKLAEAYESQRVEVMQMMTTNAIERVRARALRTFANAFLVGKKGGTDG
jgi:hypothetical protein